MYIYIRRYLISRKEKKYKFEYSKFVLEAENVDNEKDTFLIKLLIMNLMSIMIC